MGKSINLTKTKKKEPKKRLSTINEVVWGKEPEIHPLGVMSTSEIGRAQTWYHHNMKKVELKKFAWAYLKKEGYDTKPLLNKVSDDYFVNLGIVCRMVDRGAQLDYDFDKKYNELLARSKEQPFNSVVVSTAPKKTSINTDPDKVNSQYYDLVDDYIDNIHLGKKNDVVTVDAFSGLTGKHKTDMLGYIRMERGYLLDDALVKEAYNMSGKQKDSMIKFYNLVDSYLSISQQKPTKPIEPAKQVSKLKFLKASKVYGLKSIAPVKIIGKKRLLVFNNKTRRVGLFVCSGDNRLSVSGTTVQGFDTELSFVKTDRSPKDNTAKIALLSMSGAAKTFDMLKTVPQKLSGRMTEDVLILKVW